MPSEPTVTVQPTPENWPAMCVWSVANRRGVRGLPSRGFAVPERLLAEVPPELLVGAKVNGLVYYPDEARIALDAPPVDEGPLPVGEAMARLGEAMPEGGTVHAPAWAEPAFTSAASPPAVVEGDLPEFDDIATTGAPGDGESPGDAESP